MDDLPAPPDNADETIGRRLWIGNVDTKITEFALLKLLQKYGNLEKFDFLYQLTGPDKGKPRGYCFATFTNVKEAEKAQRGLNGKLALSKRLVVKPAQAEQPDSAKANNSSQSASGSTSAYPHQSTKSKISAIESRLRQLERKKDSDLDSFLPPAQTLRTAADNPASHCLESMNEPEVPDRKPGRSIRTRVDYKHKGRHRRDQRDRKSHHKPYHRR